MIAFVVISVYTVYMSAVHARGSHRNKAWYTVIFNDYTCDCIFCFAYIRREELLREIGDAKNSGGPECARGEKGGQQALKARTAIMRELQDLKAEADAKQVESVEVLF